MATTFKTLLNSDIANTRTLLHEAIPITGTITSGTYQATAAGPEENIKTFAHGMFEAVFDYPFLSSSAKRSIYIINMRRYLLDMMPKETFKNLIRMEILPVVEIK